MMMTPQQTPTTPADTGTPEGGGSSSNANLPGNDAPQESAAGPQGNSLTTKPRQTPSGGAQPPAGGMGMPGAGMPGAGMGGGTDPGNQMAGQPFGGTGGGSQMAAPKQPKEMTYSKIRNVMYDIMIDNPQMPRERAKALAQRVVMVAGVDSDDDTDNPDDNDDDKKQAPSLNISMPKGMSGGADAGAAAGAGEAAGAAAGAGEAAGLAELLPLALL